MFLLRVILGISLLASLTITVLVGVVVAVGADREGAVVLYQGRLNDGYPLLLLDVARGIDHTLIKNVRDHDVDNNTVAYLRMDNPGQLVCYVRALDGRERRISPAGAESCRYYLLPGGDSHLLTVTQVEQLIDGPWRWQIVLHDGTADTQSEWEIEGVGVQWVAPSPDGGSVLLFVDWYGARWLIYRLDVDTGTLDRMQTELEVDGVLGASDVVWSADGRYVTFNIRTPENEWLFYALDTAQGELNLLDRYTTLLANRADRSPNGERFFISRNIYDQRRLDVGNVATGGIRTVRDTSRELVAEWSPAGQYIMVRGTGPNDTYNFYLVDSHTARSTPLISDLDDTSSLLWNWSPDGHTLALPYLDIEMDAVRLLLYTPESDERTLIDGLPRSLQWFAWSPDGTSIAFGQITDSDEWQISVLGVAAGEISPPVTVQQNFFAAQWRPDSRHIIMLSSRANLMTYVFDVQTDTLHALPGHPGTENARSWSADGRYVAFTGLDTSDLFMMDMHARTITHLRDGFTSNPLWVDSLE